MSHGTWVIDSGASHNYGNNLRDFRKDSVTETNMLIKIGDKHQVQAKKKGAICLGEVEIEAFFVPEFRISLLTRRATRLTRIHINLQIGYLLNREQ